MKNDINEKLNLVMSAVFEIPIESINQKSSPETIESWDSLKHMNLIVAIEEEFNLRFDDDDIIGLNSYQSIQKTLKKY